VIVRILFALLIIGPQAASAQGWQDPRPGPVLSSADAPDILLVGEELQLGPNAIATFGVHGALGARFLSVYLLDGEGQGVFFSASLGRMQNRIGVYPVDVNGDGYNEILIEEMWEDVSSWSILTSEPWGETGTARRWHIGQLGREDDPAALASGEGNLPGADAVTALFYGDQYLDAERGLDHRPCWAWSLAQPADEPARSLSACESAGVDAEPIERFHAFSID
tara:strand:- start:2185 stop:2853 length:669 start_codon:yes stop_codon:yes gene_type:complete